MPRVCRNVIVINGANQFICKKQFELNKLMSKGIVMEKYDDCARCYPDPYYQPDYCLCTVDIIKTAELNGYVVEIEDAEYIYRKNEPL